MAPRKKRAGNEDRRHLLRVGGLVFAVLITLVTAAVLQSDPSTGVTLREIAASDRQDDIPTHASAPMELPMETPVEPSSRFDRSLPDRARGDLDRFAAGDANWTLQFLLGCDESNVSARLDELRHEPDVFLFPAEHGGDSCYVLCWGRFRDRAAAERARDFPSALGDIDPLPKSRAEILR